MRKIERAGAIKALSDMWDIAFPEGAMERVQDWGERNDLCDEWNPEEAGWPDDCRPPGIWDLLMVLGVTPQELIEHCHANPALFESSAHPTSPSQKDG